MIAQNAAPPVAVVVEPAACAHTIWEGLSGTPAYHPICHWAALCRKQGCFWQLPISGLAKQQRGLDL